jgi:exonuclease III
VRVLTWNVAHNPENWAVLDRVHEVEAVEVALLQEATRPDRTPQRHAWPDPSHDTDWSTAVAETPRRWRTAVIWWESFEVVPLATGSIAEVGEEEETLPESAPGLFTAVRVGNTSLVSLYGLWEHLAGSREAYSVASVHRSISDLTRLWIDRRDPKVVIAGDWNLWRGYGQWAARYSTVFSRLEAEGFSYLGPRGTSPLERCPCGTAMECTHVQTYWRHHKAESVPYQTDFVAATEAVRIHDCRVLSHLEGQPLWRSGVSDHAPVVFDLDDA